MFQIKSQLLIFFGIFLISFGIFNCSNTPLEPDQIVDQHGKTITLIPEPGLNRTDQKEIKNPIPLLLADGKLNVSGWARYPYFQIDESFIKAEPKRYKRWEHYTFYNEKFGGAVTITDIGNLAMGSIELLEFSTGKVLFSKTELVRPGEIFFPTNTIDPIEFKKGDQYIRITKLKGKRVIEYSINGDSNSAFIKGNLELEEKAPEALAVITPFSESTFFYEYKMPSLLCKGSIEHNNISYEFSDKSYAVLDWGRGTWPEKNKWLWAAGAGLVDGELLSLNLGYGFGIPNNATENGIVYKGKVHKLDKVTWKYDVTDYKKPWKFISNEGRLELEFTPVYLLHSDIDLMGMIGFLKQLYQNFTFSEILELLKTEAYLNKAFGHYNGYVVLDNGTKLIVKDLAGFAEQMYQQW
ncbi:DUF2804 domain-containing protein [Leptospira sp. 2 VSF19]|uniref:DUF2804 domain-containing protein n=1 Tax=Leptospira soteropolitanensis TaxID=2950025 RepID=A0AAW5VJ94_9LEPT|nr:DUF2804 domain-containing protein [Leptospira soteropolitanensis]MCW7491655.1 DUF2804 domain-containing protein [Leptospira soteropolitanensis]MCW7499239.1 DUF2804 domain-containing protein [Leptospira soteropolitanensis]MCW7521169.1 DUF2804 domain-containing protein [Leptospira soteropolitanensis]MCW7525343.1 DUF2804 domain-containing protein [Leptospira soteropolitanensis]MCW7529210.1 DUF2804 domain-containing protein [Leptospira soteropolitanensis]